VSGTARITELAVELGSGPRWAMVRTHFGIGAFGVNAYVADEPGIAVIGEHDELGKLAAQHEELYFVADGHAKFTVDGDEIDAPAGTFVFVRDPAAKRGAVATEAGTTVVIAGGKPGEAFAPSAWERSAPAFVHFGARDYDKAIAEFERLRAETPDDAGVLYNLACAESLGGKKTDAVEHLSHAVEIDPDFRRLAEKDSDFDSIRAEPEFLSLVAGEPGTGSSRA
jgi:tetratricopeptide (TPR) repeat protein